MYKGTQFLGIMKMRGRGGRGRGRSGGGRGHVQRNYDRYAGQPRPDNSKIARSEMNVRKAWVLQNWSGSSTPAFHVSLGCGQGGDAHKLTRALPMGSTVLNVDFSDLSLEEFQNRVANVPLLTNSIEWLFECADLTSWVVPDHFRGNAHSASCMLAMHYFAHDTYTLTDFFTNVVQALLKEDGVFTAVYPDPDVVLDCMRTLDENNCHHSELFSMQVRPDHLAAYQAGETDSLSYRFSLEGTMSNVEEYLVSQASLVSALTASGLTLLEQTNLYNIGCGSLRSAMGLRGDVSSVSAQLLRLYTAIRVRK